MKNARGTASNLSSPVQRPSPTQPDAPDHALARVLQRSRPWPLPLRLVAFAARVGVAAAAAFVAAKVLAAEGWIAVGLAAFGALLLG